MSILEAQAQELQGKIAACEKRIAELKYVYETAIKSTKEELSVFKRVLKTTESGIEALTVVEEEADEQSTIPNE